MSKQIAEFYAKITADTKGVEKGLKDTKTGLASLQSGLTNIGASSLTGFLSMSGAIAGVSAVIKDTVNENTRYADSIRQIQLITGQSAEQASKIIQVTDDYKISVDSLSTAQRTLSAQGKTLSEDTLIGLARAYQAAGDGAAKAEILTKNFGRSGLQFAELLSQTPAKLSAAFANVNTDLIFNQQQVTNARDYQKALDELGDSVTGLKLEFSTGIIPNLTAFTQRLTTGIQGFKQLGSFFDILGKKGNDFGQQLAVSLGLPKNSLNDLSDGVHRFMLGVQTLGLSEAFRPGTQAVTDVNDAFSEGSSMLRDYGEGIHAAAGAFTDWTQIIPDFGAASNLTADLSGIKDQFETSMSDLLVKKSELDEKFKNNPGAAEYKKQLGDITSQMDTLKSKTQDAINAQIFGLIGQQMQASGALGTQAGFEQYTAVGQALGQLDKDSAAYAVNILKIVDAQAQNNGSMQETVDLLKNQSAQFVASAQAEAQADAASQISNQTMTDLIQKKKDGAISSQQFADATKKIDFNSLIDKGASAKNSIQILGGQLDAHKITAKQFSDAIMAIWALPADKAFHVTFDVAGNPNIATGAPNVTTAASTGSVSQVPGQGGYIPGLAKPKNKASGGRLSAGDSYWVGEAGPELAQWTGGGWNIVPNNQLRGGMAGGGFLPSGSSNAMSAGANVNITINNPVPEPASTSLTRAKILQYTGAFDPR